VSLRSRAVGLNRFLREFARRYGASGGDHPNAAGARMPKPLLQVLVQELNSSFGVMCR